MNLFFETFLAGLLQSGIYALVASGLALSVGVIHIVNFAHGEFLMVGAFLSWGLFTWLGMDPLLSAVVAALAMFAGGALTYRTTIKHVLLAPELNQMLLTFGISIILQNLALLIFGGNTRLVNTPYQGEAVMLFGLSVGLTKLLAFGLALVLLIGLYLMLYRSRLGRSMRAVAQNRLGAQIIGLDVHRIYLIAFGIASSLAGVAGVLVSVLLFASPTVGLVYTLKAFAIIVMAGLGNMTGVLWASLLLALSEAYVQTYVPGGGRLSEAVFFLLIFGTLVFRASRGAK